MKQHVLSTAQNIKVAMESDTDFAVSHLSHPEISRNAKTKMKLNLARDFRIKEGLSPLRVSFFSNRWLRVYFSIKQYGGRERKFNYNCLVVELHDTSVLFSATDGVCM